MTTTAADTNQSLRELFEANRDRVTLNGVRASILGWQNEFLEVWQFGGTGVRVEFSRAAVARVLARDCAFRA